MARPSSPRPSTFCLHDPPVHQNKRSSRFLEEIDESPNDASGKNTPFSTSYMNMFLQLDTISTIHNILAWAFTWLLLAGFVSLPGAFTSIMQSRTLQAGGRAGKTIAKAAQNIPLLAVAVMCSGIGLIGMSWLGWLYQSNYLWLVNRIILPGLFNSMTGLISTLINIYTARSGFWSVTAIITAAITGGSTGFMLVLYLVYGVWRLNKIKKEHRLQVQAENARLSKIRVERSRRDANK